MRVGQLELLTDLSPAAWLGECRGNRADEVGSWVPPVYEAYARLFHPFRGVETSVPWSEVAARYGRVAHRAMQFEGVTGIERHSGDLDGLSEPEEGSLPLRTAQELAALLQAFTGTPDRCYFGVWEGWGGLRIGRGGSASYAILGSRRAVWKARQRLRWHRLRGRFRRRAESIPKFQIPGREYYLLSGPLDGIGETFHEPNPLWDSNPWQSANLWWPEDRSWFVATEIDLMSTFVGGSRVCIDALLVADGLEALEVDVDQPVSRQAETINPLPRIHRDD